MELCFRENDALVLSQVKHIDYEYRTIIKKGKYITGCQYKSYCKETNRLGFDPCEFVPDDVVEMANKLALRIDLYPDPMYVLDLVKSGNEISVMEINALSTSGWYDCDYGKIIDAIEECI